MYLCVPYKQGYGKSFLERSSPILSHCITRNRTGSLTYISGNMTASEVKKLPWYTVTRHLKVQISEDTCNPGCVIHTETQRIDTSTKFVGPFSITTHATEEYARELFWLEGKKILRCDSLGFLFRIVKIREREREREIQVSEGKNVRKRKESG